MAGALTSLPDDFSPPGAPMYGTGQKGRDDALDGFNESFNGSMALVSTALTLAGARGGSGNVRNLLRGYLKGKGLSEEAVTGRPWKVGDPIDALTAKGSDPAWTTVRTRYWKNEAAAAEPGEYSPSDMARMEQGKAPLHPQIGVSKELDHIIQRNAGGTHAQDNLREVWPWEHDALDPYRHYTGPRPEGFDPDQFIRSAHK